MTSSSYAQVHGKSLLLPVNARDCGEPPFQFDFCACGWSEYCHADRLLGHDDAASAAAAAAAAGGGGGGPDGAAKKPAGGSVGGAAGQSHRKGDGSRSGGSTPGTATNESTFAAAVSRYIKGALQVAAIELPRSPDATVDEREAVQVLIDAVCDTPSPEELVVISCPSPGVLFAMDGAAPFELLLRSVSQHEVQSERAWCS